MRAAPDLFPPLDDALRALDGFPGRPADVATARRFLEQLDDVRDVPAVVLDQAQAELMEGAYRAGVRCADESGHVLVVSLPVLLELLARRTSAPRWSWRAVLEQLLAVPALLLIAAACAACSLVAFGIDEDPVAGAWLLFGALGWALLAWILNGAPLAAPCPPNCEECNPRTVAGAYALELDINNNRK